VATGNTLIGRADSDPFTKDKDELSSFRPPIGLMLTVAVAVTTGPETVSVSPSERSTVNVIHAVGCYSGILM